MFACARAETEAREVWVVRRDVARSRRLGYRAPWWCLRGRLERRAGTHRARTRLPAGLSGAIVEGLRVYHSHQCMYLVAPPPPAVRAGGAGGLVLPGETAAHASETLAYSGICVRHVITRLGRRLRRRALLWRISSACFCPAVPRGAAQQFRSRSSSRAHGQVQ